jgi:hypothetical protein
VSQSVSVAFDLASIALNYVGAVTVVEPVIINYQTLTLLNALVASQN